MTSKDINNFLSRVTLFREQNGKLLSLNLGVYNNTLRLYIRESDLEKKEQSKLVCNLSIQPEKARYLKEMLYEINKLELKDDKDKRELEVKLYGIEWDKNGRPIPNSRVLIGSLIVGKVKNKENEIVNYLGVTNKYGKKFVFPFLPTPYEEYYIDGKKIENKTVLSNIKLKSYRATLENILNFIPEAIPELEEIKNNIRNKRNQNSNFNNKNKTKNDTTTNVENESVVIEKSESDDIDDLF